MRFVISERNPGVANWLELTGHTRGYVQLRWQRLTRDLGRKTGRRSKWCRSRKSGKGCRTTTARGCPPMNGGGVSPRARPRSRKGCSVDTPGQGSRGGRHRAGLGRSIALASAREGADVVLAARTAARLDDVAKEIAALGRRGLAVPTDVADPEAAERLAAAARDAFGRVDALVYNALAMPPIKELGVVPLDAMARARRERGRRAAPDQAVHPCPRGEQGLRGDDQLDGGAVLAADDGTVQAREGGAARDGAEPGHRTGPANHPGQFRRPRAHLGRLAEVVLRLPARARRGGMDIYAETAAPIDLGRLPEPDEIADAVVFLASPMARAITGRGGRQLRRVPPLIPPPQILARGANQVGTSRTCKRPRRGARALTTSARMTTPTGSRCCSTPSRPTGTSRPAWARRGNTGAAARCPVGPAVQRRSLAGEPAVRRGQHRPPGLHHRAAADRDHGTAPAARGGPGQPGA